MIIQEGTLEFNFKDEDWTFVIKYDTSEEHRRIERMDGSKAIDIMAKNTSNTFILMEIKDFRGHAISTKHRLNPDAKDPIEKELSLKLRNTIPGIVSGARNKGINQNNYIDLLMSLSNIKKDVQFIFWFERDMEKSKNPKKRYSRKDPLLQRIKKELSWLNIKVRIANSHDHPFKENDSLSVSNLPNS